MKRLLLFLGNKNMTNASKDFGFMHAVQRRCELAPSNNHCMAIYSDEFMSALMAVHPFTAYVFNVAILKFIGDGRNTDAQSSVLKGFRITNSIDDLSVDVKMCLGWLCNGYKINSLRVAAFDQLNLLDKNVKAIINIK